MLPSLLHRFHTQRLTGFPLSYQQVLHYLACDGTLEQELALRYQERQVDPGLRAVLEETVLPQIEQGDSASPLASLWLLVDRQKHRIVGSFLFKSQPNAAGEVEIGYGTEQGLYNQGYMTEAIGGLIDWATEHAPIRALLAETALDNLPSQKVLQKNGFEPIQNTETHSHWRRALP